MIPRITGFISILKGILFKPYTVATATGVITITGLVPANDVLYPQGATHMTLKGAWAKINFQTGVTQLQLSNVVNLPINTASGNVVLTPVGTPTGVGTNLFLLEIEFFQMVNGSQYSLKNGAFNALCIVEVS